MAKRRHWDHGPEDICLICERLVLLDVLKLFEPVHGQPRSFDEIRSKLRTRYRKNCKALEENTKKWLKNTSRSATV